MLSRFAQRGSVLSNPLKSRGVLASSLPSRNYGNMTQECADQLKSLGITNQNVVFNPS